MGCDGWDSKSKQRADFEGAELAGSDVKRSHLKKRALA